jgi:hypothetical protein
MYITNIKVYIFKNHKLIYRLRLRMRIPPVLLLIPPANLRAPPHPPVGDKPNPKTSATFPTFPTSPEYGPPRLLYILAPREISLCFLMKLPAFRSQEPNEPPLLTLPVRLRITLRLGIFMFFYIIVQESKKICKLNN